MQVENKEKRTGLRYDDEKKYYITMRIAITIQEIWDLSQKQELSLIILRAGM